MKANLLLVVGLVFCRTTIFAESNSPTFALVVPEGMHAVAIHVGEKTLMDGSVKTGDRVDILATYDDPRTKQQVTKFILQNVRVLAVDKGRTDPSRNGGAETSLTLAVPPQQTELVAAADEVGALRVSLRLVEGEYVGVSTRSPENIAVPSRPAVGDFWLPGEFERLLEERKRERREKTE